jgi:hypothetical protein
MGKSALRLLVTGDAWLMKNFPVKKIEGDFFDVG